MTKWGQRPHWEYDALLLGADEHGDWIGVPSGTPMSRPGADYVAPTSQVVLVPTGGPDELRGFVATFHAVGGPVQVYVDITTPPVWVAATVCAVDLDLDVVVGPSGRVWVEDEDELARHRVELGYPERVVTTAVASCERVRDLAVARTAPFDGTADRWQAELVRLLGSPTQPGAGSVEA